MRQGAYNIERACEGRERCGMRGAECSRVGFHTVDRSDDLPSALADAAELARSVRVAYRVTERLTGKVLS